MKVYFTNCILVGISIHTMYELAAFIRTILIRIINHITLIGICFSAKVDLMHRRRYFSPKYACSIHHQNNPTFQIVKALLHKASIEYYGRMLWFPNPTPTPVLMQLYFFLETE